MSISEFKARCLAVIEQVHQTGDPLLITKRGVTIAEVIPAPAPFGEKRILGSPAGDWTIVGNIVDPVSDPGDWDVLGN